MTLQDFKPWKTHFIHLLHNTSQNYTHFFDHNEHIKIICPKTVYYCRQSFIRQNRDSFIIKWKGGAPTGFQFMASTQLNHCKNETISVSAMTVPFPFIQIPPKSALWGSLSPLEQIRGCCRGRRVRSTVALVETISPAQWFSWFLWPIKCKWSYCKTELLCTKINQFQWNLGLNSLDCNKYL